MSRVDFYADASPIDSDTSPPFAIIWSDMPVGQYAVTAEATDNLDASTLSSPINIVVKATGDFDGDGDVDQDDFGTFQSCVGDTSAPCMPVASLNGDAIVNEIDLSIFLQMHQRSKNPRRPELRAISCISRDTSFPSEIT